MDADSSTLADEYTASPHRNNGTEHRLNIELPDHPLSSKGPVETEESAPAVRTHVEEITPVMAESIDATVPVPPAPSTDTAPTPVSKFETQLRNIMAFRGLPDTEANLTRVATEDCMSRVGKLEELMKMREKVIRSIRNEIYQVVGFYSAFQGLLLTAIAQSNLLHWNNRGYPLALSAFATGIAAIGVVLKNKVITDLKKTLGREKAARKALWRRDDRLRTIRIEFLFQDVYRTKGIEFLFQDVYRDECKQEKRETMLNMLFSLLFTYETSVVATLITFGALCVASMLQILHHPGIPA